MAYGTRRFNVAFTRCLQLSLSWAESTQLPTMIPISSRSILILSSHLRLGVGLPVTILEALLPYSILATCPTHLIFLDLITLTILGERWKLSLLFSLKWLEIVHLERRGQVEAIVMEHKSGPANKQHNNQPTNQNYFKSAKMTKWHSFLCYLVNCRFDFNCRRYPIILHFIVLS
jgi:hypothetical protein